MVESRLPNSKVGAKFFEELKNLPVRSLTFLNLLDMANIFISFNRIMVAKKFVLQNIKSGSSLQGSANQSFFKLNRTLNEPKEAPKSMNDKTFSNFMQNQLSEQAHTPKHSNQVSKLNTMKSLNEKIFSRKESGLQNMSRQNEAKKEKELKSYMKISEFYCPETLSINKIEKRASFLFPSTQNNK